MSRLLRVLSKIRKKWVYLYWYVINLPVLYLSHSEFDTSLKLRGRLRIRSRGVIKMGRNVTINSSVMANPLGGSPCSILVAQIDAEIRIGNDTGMSNICIFARQRVEIQDHVMLGAGVKIYDNDFHPVEYEARMENQPPKTAPVTIQSGAFIGAHSIILKGVTIGKNSVIGAGSVVTKSVPDGEIWAGNPARCIKGVE